VQEHAVLSPPLWNLHTARCREENGVSAMHWLRSQRLLQARLLRDGGLPVAEAARRCGYRSPSALTAAMRRESLLH